MKQPVSKQKKDSSRSTAFAHMSFNKQLKRLTEFEKSSALANLVVGKRKMVKS